MHGVVLTVTGTKIATNSLLCSSRDRTTNTANTTSGGALS